MNFTLIFIGSMAIEFFFIQLTASRLTKKKFLRKINFLDPNEFAKR